MVVTVEGSITFFRAIHLLKRFGAITVIPSSKVASTSASQYPNKLEASVPIS